MNTEKREQIKIALLAIIALVLLYQTGVKFFSDDKKSINTPYQNQALQQGTNTPVAPLQQNTYTPPGQQSVPITPGQQNLNINPTPQAPLTTMKFDKNEVNLGSLQQGTKATHTFTITNSGDNPLVLNGVTGDMGVTVLEYPTNPIPKGGTGEIKVQYEGADPVGSWSKTIHVNANTTPNHAHLTLSGETK